MTVIKVSGNRASYQLTRTISNLEITLAGDFDFNANTRINFVYDNWHLHFENRQALFKFSEEIRGGGLDKMILLFNKYNFGNDFVKSLTDKKTIETGLLKSIFLIYYWIELPITAPFELDLEKQIYNDFVIDFTNQLEPQRDIYFIDKRYITNINEPLISTLIDLNLLATLNLTVDNKEFKSYFIPLIKPGVPKEMFYSYSNGTQAYNLWKKILRDRDIRIFNWVNNRF